MRLIEVKPQDATLLYTLLGERTAEESISHRKMPSWIEHLEFVCNHPYKHWYWIVILDQTIGAIYLTKQREIGIQIFNSYKRQGYGSKAIKKLMRMHPGEFLANINPKNTASKELFKGFGFYHIQNTYRKDADSS